MLMMSIMRADLSRLSRLSVTALVLLGLCLAGCSRKEKPLSPVSGQVTLDGQPLSAGSLLLVSDLGQAASATLDMTGRYNLLCPPGRYLVAISPPPPPDPMTAGITPLERSDKMAIPKRYQEVSTSGEAIDVSPGSNTFDLTLTSKPQ